MRFWTLFAVLVFFSKETIGLKCHCNDRFRCKNYEMCWTKVNNVGTDCGCRKTSNCTINGCDEFGICCCNTEDFCNTKEWAVDHFHLRCAKVKDNRVTNETCTKNDFWCYAKKNKAGSHVKSGCSKSKHLNYDCKKEGCTPDGDCCCKLKPNCNLKFISRKEGGGE